MEGCEKTNQVGHVSYIQNLIALSK